ncbi:hypothetical protein [Actinomycetospora straminea]|nr:hypothetical protein [Actinomycetospora straminea]MDD7933723.1 hypothetical protein [Actinomycetospora straminea]
MENDDQTAQTQMELMSAAGLDITDITPRNAYPWYIIRVSSP